MASELLIKINGSAKQFNEELSKVEKGVTDLDGKLKSLATISGVAFGALIGTIGFSVKAFAEAEQASNSLTQSLKNQGIFSAQLVESYKSQAKELQNLNGIDDDTIIKSQSVLQNFLGQEKVTKELTQAVIDLSVAQGIDLASAATLVGKSIGTSTNALARNGIEVDSNASKQERMAQIIDGVNQKFGGQAKAANQGLGGIKNLGIAFGNLQEELGERFAPVVIKVTEALTKALRVIANNKPFIDFAAKAILVATAFTGIATALGVFGIAALKAIAITKALTATFGTLGLSIRAAVGATGIGLLIVGLSLLVENWETVFPKMEAIFLGFVKTITKLGESLSNILKGIFTFDIESVKTGIEQVKEAFSQGFAEASKEIKPIKAEVDTSSTGAGGNRAPSGGFSKEAEKEEKKQQVEVTKQREADERTRERVAENISSLFGSMQQGAEGAAGAVAAIGGTIANVLLPGIGSAVQAALEFFAQGPEKVKEQITAFIENIPVVLDSIFASLAALLSPFIASIVAQIGTMLTSIIDGLLTAVEDILVSFDETVTKLVEGLATSLDKIIARLPEIVNRLVELAPQIVVALATLMPTVSAELTKYLVENADEILVALGRAAIEGVANAILASFEAIINGFVGVINKIPGVRTDQVSLPRLKLADGGFATGGTQGQDSIPAMLMPGELVVPTDRVPTVLSALYNQLSSSQTNSRTPGGQQSVRVEIGFSSVEAEKILTARQVEARTLGVYRGST